MRSDTPVTVYLRMPEADLLALSPITRLVLDSLIQEQIATYDHAADAGEEEMCRPVLFVLDEAGRTASLASLPDHLGYVQDRYSAENSEALFIRGGDCQFMSYCWRTRESRKLRLVHGFFEGTGPWKCLCREVGLGEWK
jgi:hypothetical protein